MEQFSKREDKILKALTGKDLNVSQIAEAIFKNDKNAPLDQKISVTNSINRIIMKCSHYKLSWTLVKTKGAGAMIISKRKACWYK